MLTMNVADGARLALQRDTIALTAARLGGRFRFLAVRELRSIEWETAGTAITPQRLCEELYKDGQARNQGRPTLDNQNGAFRRETAVECGHQDTKEKKELD